IISMISAEVEPLGGYIGEAVSLPVFQGGTLLTILAFIMVQDPFLGVAAIALYPVQMYLIPKLQKKVNLLGKKRVQTARKLSERISESVSGIQDIHTHDTSAFERANISDWLGQIFDIRYEIYRRKFFIKFLNNFIAQLTPFFFYSLGGVLVIKGNLSFGSLVAVIAAYKDLADPWKELLKNYQTAMDAKIKYEQLVEQFHPEGLLDKSMQLDPPAQVPVLEGEFEASNVVVEDDTGFKVLDGLTARIPLKGTTAVLGAVDSGRDDLIRLLVRLIFPQNGKVRLGGLDTATLHEAIIGRNISYVDHNAYVFGGSIRDNLLYGLKHRPVRDRELEGEQAARRNHFITEAKAAGNTPDDLHAQWVDYEHFEAHNGGLETQILKALKLTGLAEDVHEFGLKARLDPRANPEMTGRIMEARKLLKARLLEPEMATLVEPFDKDLFNDNMTVGENIMMGRLVSDAFDFDQLSTDPYMLSILERSDMKDWFLETGLKVAETMVELFKDLPPGHEFFARFSFIDASELPEYQLIIRKAANGLETLDTDEQARLRGLPFLLSPARHRLDVVDDDIRRKILVCRRNFAEHLPENLKSAIEFYDEDTYSATASVRDNILFGKIAHGRAKARRKVGRLIHDIVEKLDLTRTIMELGLDTSVGVAGGRLSASQRQKLCLARALIKDSPILVLNNPLSAQPPKAQQAIMQAILEQNEDRGLVWVLNRSKDAEKFENMITMKDGRVVEAGKVASLLSKAENEVEA
ncbi:MAG TPA: ABC transporter ATP-binding protein, partial [Rhizobiales bacterium]|nr:ABC transporter ATP-binding protein [Hyphomicrobiales bacterium]